MLDELCQLSVGFRLDKARSCLKSAEILLANEAYADYANRSYFAIYHALRSVLITDRFSAKKHSGNITEFRRRYIKPGIFPKEFSDIIGNAFEVRTDCDYEDFYIVSKEDVSNQLNNAKIFLEAVETYIQTLKEQ